MVPTNEKQDGPSTSASAPKLDADTLALRARPRPVTRISRRAVILLSGTGLLLISGATLVALDPPRLFDRDPSGPELYHPDHTPRPEGLDELPRHYGDLPPPPVELGPPLPGDLGGAVLEAERELGLEPPRELPFRPDPEDDAARAERIRQARLAQQGRESSVFVQLTSQGTGAAFGQAAAMAAPPAVPEDPDPAAGGFADAPEPQPPGGETDPGLQGRKLAFLNDGPDPAIYNPHALQQPASPYQLMAGSVIAASLITGLNSDLPAPVIAQVTEPVYDTVTGRHLLIPQGARVLGTYDSVVAFGQERALVVWQRLLLPDGSSIVVDNLPATDTAGYAGLEDEVDVHTWRLLSGIALATLLGVSTELTFGDSEGDLVRALRQSTQDSLNQVGRRLTERHLSVQPTLTIRPGWPLRILVHKDLVLRPYRPRN